MILMDDNISDGKHLCPWKVWIPCLNLRGYLTRGFADDFKISQYRIYCFLIILKVIEGISFGVSANLGDTGQDICDA
jgi:hypothetical protein